MTVLSKMAMISTTAAMSTTCYQNETNMNILITLLIVVRAHWSVNHCNNIKMVGQYFRDCSFNHNTHKHKLYLQELIKDTRLAPRQHENLNFSVLRTYERLSCEGDNTHCFTVEPAFVYHVNQSWSLTCKWHSLQEVVAHNKINLLQLFVANAPCSWNPRKMWNFQAIFLSSNLLYSLIFCTKTAHSTMHYKNVTHFHSV